MIKIEGFDRVLDEIQKERNVDKTVLRDAVAAALLSASRKKLPHGENLDASIDEQGTFVIYAKNDRRHEGERPPYRDKQKRSRKADQRSQGGRRGQGGRYAFRLRSHGGPDRETGHNPEDKGSRERRRLRRIHQETGRDSQRHRPEKGNERIPGQSGQGGVRASFLRIHPRRALQAQRKDKGPDSRDKEDPEGSRRHHLKDQHPTS